jgi:hypothetical protein
MSEIWKVKAVERAFEIALLSAELHEKRYPGHKVGFAPPYTCATCKWVERWSAIAAQEKENAGWIR